MHDGSLVEYIARGAPPSEALYRSLLHWRDAAAWEGRDVLKRIPSGRCDVYCRQAADEARRKGQRGVVLFEETTQTSSSAGFGVEEGGTFQHDRLSHHVEFVTATTTRPTDGYDVTRVKQLIPSGGASVAGVVCVGQLIRVDNYRTTLAIMSQQLDLQQQISVIELQNVRSDVDGLYIVDSVDWDDKEERLIVGFSSIDPVYEPVESKRRYHEIWNHGHNATPATLTERFRIDSRALYHVVLHAVPETLPQPPQPPQQELSQHLIPWNLTQGDGSSCGSGSRMGSGSGKSARASSPCRKQRRDPPGFSSPHRAQTVQFTPPPLYNRPTDAPTVATGDPVLTQPTPTDPILPQPTPNEPYLLQPTPNEVAGQNGVGYGRDMEARMAPPMTESTVPVQPMTLWPEPISPPAPPVTALEPTPNLPLPLTRCVQDVYIPKSHPLSSLLPSMDCGPESRSDIRQDLPALPPPFPEELPRSEPQLNGAPHVGIGEYRREHSVNGVAGLRMDALVYRSEEEIVNWTVHRLKSNPSLLQPFVQGWMDDCGKDVFLEKLLTLPDT